MPAFAPQRVYSPHHFDIKRNRHGYWIASDRGGLVGGTFLTRKDALRFALFETDGDSAHVHTYPEPKPVRLDGVRPRRRTGAPS
jgi:hypothetical protein